MKKRKYIPLVICLLLLAAVFAVPALAIDVEMTVEQMVTRTEKQLDQNDVNPYYDEVIWTRCSWSKKDEVPFLGDGPVVTLNPSDPEVAASCKITAVNPGTVTVFTSQSFEIVHNNHNPPEHTYRDFNSVTVYHITVLGPAYNVGLDANGGTIVGGANQVAVRQGGKYGRNGALPQCQWDDCEFDGWYTEREGGTKVTDDTIVAKEKPHTLYAHWKETITIEGGGEMLLGDTMDLKAVVEPAVLHPTLTWSTANPEVVTVNPNTGSVTGTVPGHAAVTVTSKNGTTKDCHVTVLAAPEITSEERDGGVEICVSLPQNTTAAGGSLELVYDPARMKLEDAQAGGLLAGGLASVNKTCDFDRVRLTFAMDHPLTEAGTLLTAVFRGNGEASVENLRLIDKNGQRLPSTCPAPPDPSAKPPATVPGAAITPSISVVKQDGGIQVSVSVQEKTDAAGGSFELVYDPAKLTLKDTQRGSLTNFGHSSVNRDDAGGAVHMSFAMPDALAAGGVLLTAYFEGPMPESGELAVERFRLVNASSAPLSTADAVWRAEALSEPLSLSEPAWDGAALHVTLSGEEGLPRNAKVIAAFYKGGRMSGIAVQAARMGELTFRDNIPAEWDKAQVFLLSRNWSPLYRCVQLQR